MNYNDRINVLMNAISENITLSPEQLLAVKSGLIDGFLRIVQAESLEERAAAVMYSNKCPICGKLLKQG